MPTSSPDVVRPLSPTGTPTTRSARWGAPALASLGGFAVALSLPPWGWWPLAFVGTTLLVVALGDDPGRPRRRGLIGASFAVPWMLMGMGWMWFLTVPGYFVAAALFSALHGLAAAISPTGRWAVVGRPAAHTLVEAGRFAAPFGGIPLASLGISQAGGWFLPLARFGGVIVITWFVFQVGALIGDQLVDRRRERPRPAGWLVRPPWRTPEHAASVAVAAVLCVAVFAATGDDLDAPPLVITAVQAGGEQGTSALDVPSRVVTERLLAATATIEPDPGRDVVVWPENGIDVNRMAFADSDVRAEVAAEAERLGVPLLVGVTLDAPYSAHPRQEGFVNAQVVVLPDGTIGDSYEKVRIVPFGEYVPLRDILEALGAPLDQLPRDAVPGRDDSVLVTPDGARYGVVISWEVFFGDRARAAADSDVIINPTNGASYTGTILQTQQVASSKLRAAETGRWVVQVSPTGFSAFVSPDGDVFDRTDVSEQAVIERAVPRRTGTTWYTRTGDAPWMVAVLLVLVGSHVGAGRGGRRRAQEGSNQSSPSPPR